MYDWQRRALAVILTIGALMVAGVWLAALMMSDYVRPGGAIAVTGLVIVLCGREMRTRNLVSTVFELGYRIGFRDARTDP